MIRKILLSLAGFFAGMLVWGMVVAAQCVLNQNGGSLGLGIYYSAFNAIAPLTGVVHAYPFAPSLANAVAACPASGSCNVIADSGAGNYTVSSPVIWGTLNTAEQTITLDGSTVQCTNTGGAGNGCLVVGNWGKLIGTNRNNSTVSTASNANIDSLVESYTAYQYSTNATQYQQINMDVEHIEILPGAATIQKAAFWISGIDGDGNFDDIYVGPSTATNIPAGILVDDAPTGSAYTGMFWNALNFRQIWIGMGTDIYGMKILCGATSGSSGSNLVWNGGAIVDGSNQATAEFSVSGGSNGACKSISQRNNYYESITGQTGDFIDISGAGDVSLDTNYYNGGPTLTNCISIANVAGNQLHASGYASACTNIVTNSVANQTLTYLLSGSVHGFNFDYNNPTFASGSIKQVGKLVNPFGPGGPAGLYYSAAGTALPACASTYARYFECVSDSTACTSGTTYTSGGSTACLLQCNNAGNAWKETGVGCF